MKKQKFLKAFYFIFLPILAFFLLTKISFNVHELKTKVSKLQDNNKVILYNIADFSKLKPARGWLREIQLDTLNALKDCEKFFKENDVQYWLEWGSLLGAVRNAGFIPWDDDMDIAMIRSDYEKLLEIAKKNPKINDDLEFYFQFKNDIIHIKSKTKLVEIDITPYDFVDKDKISEYIGKRERFLSIWMKILPKKRLKYALARSISLKYSVKNSDYVFQSLEDNDIRDPRTMFTKASLFPLRRLKFEGVDVLVPNDYDRFLKAKYGDYMDLPSDFGVRKHF